LDTWGLTAASRGLSVGGFDVDSEKVARINNGEVPFHEPIVSELPRRSLKAGFKASN
jgi:UDPglucose 6-dehydrogenase